MWKTPYPSTPVLLCLGVNIENGTRHPSVLSVAVNVGCWNHRRGHLVFTKDGQCTVLSHSGVKY